MSCSLNSHSIISKPLPQLPLPKLLIQWPLSPPQFTPKLKQSLTSLTCKVYAHTQKQQQLQELRLGLGESKVAIQVGALLLATAEQPALAITGVNNQEDITWVLIQLGISAFIYFLVVPPFIMNWLRLRWYKRNLLEMYLQFMCVFIFFPGMMLWAPFVNVRKLPRDPNMKYPWSVPDDPSKIKNDYLRYPWAKEDDYEVF